MCVMLHPVSVRRFPSFRTQPLGNLTPLPMNKWISEQPSPWRKYYKRKLCYGDRMYCYVARASLRMSKYLMSLTGGGGNH